MRSILPRVGNSNFPQADFCLVSDDAQSAPWASCVKLIRQDRTFPTPKSRRGQWVFRLMSSPLVPVDRELDFTSGKDES